MLVIPGHRCHTCEGPTRRELLRAGSIGMLGLNLANFFAWQKHRQGRATKYEGARGFGSAKSVIMVFLQGGPSHIDIWDPKPDAPAQHPRRVQADQDQDSRHPHQREHADDGRRASTRPR